MPKVLNVRPSVHLLCTGVFLQETVQLSKRRAFVPLKPLDFETPARWLATYAAHCGAQVDSEALKALIQQGISANPCVAIIHPVEAWTTPEEAESSCSSQLERLRELLSWGTGNEVQPFGYLVAGPEPSKAYFRLLLPTATKRTRLGFGNTGSDFTGSLLRIIEKADSDEHFAFALSMLHDANAEQNVRFKIARYYSCLEALAYKIKKGQGSREAVRQLLGLKKGRTGQVSIGTDNRKYDYDVVLGAGILRDLLYHGVPLDFSSAKPAERDTFDLIERHPDVIANDLRGRVELEIARWSNNASNGQREENCA